jgi:hypothetical protein
MTTKFLSETLEGRDYLGDQDRWEGSIKMVCKNKGVKVWTGLKLALNRVQ